MAQLVFEFWSLEIEPVVDAINRILDGCPTKNGFDIASPKYQSTPKGLDWGAEQLRTGDIGNFLLEPRTGSIRYALLFGPQDGCQRTPLDYVNMFSWYKSAGTRPGYMGTIEYTRYNYLHIWDGLLDVDGVQIACLGSEEGIEFSVNQLTAETFPWQDRCLVIGAVRSPAGWVLKRGPNYFPAEYIDRVLQSGLNARLRGPGRIFPRSHRKWCQAMMMLPAPIFAECRFVSSLEAMRFSHSIAASLSLSVFQDPGGHPSPFQSNRLAVVSSSGFHKSRLGLGALRPPAGTCLGFPIHDLVRCRLLLPKRLDRCKKKGTSRTSRRHSQDTGPPGVDTESGMSPELLAAWSNPLHSPRTSAPVCRNCMPK